MRLASILKPGKLRLLCTLAEDRVQVRESFIKAILGCDNRKAVQEVHVRIATHGLGEDLFLGSCLVHRYLHCGSVSDAWSIFPRLHETDVITWTRLIAAFAQNGHFYSALHVFRVMQLEGVHADSVTFITVLNSCAKFGALEQGREIHAYIVEKGFNVVSRVGNSLVDLYTKCLSLDDACKAFTSLHQPDVVSWNTLVHATATCSGYKETLTLYQNMQLEGMKPDAFTLVTVLNACNGPGSTATAREIQERVLELGSLSETVVCNALINTYGKAGQLKTAREIFERTVNKDMITWNVIISAYATADLKTEAFHLYSRMQLEGVRPTEAAFLTVLNACMAPDDLLLGKRIHSTVNESCCSSQARNSLVGMYGRCGSVEDAQTAFDEMLEKNVVSWNSLLGAYAVNGLCEHALHLYHSMQLEGLLPTNVTFASVLNACSEASLLTKGRLIHANLEESGYSSAGIIICALVDMYCKCGNLDEARHIFLMHPSKNEVLWTAIIGGYSEAGNSTEALKIFKYMQLDGMTPNKVTLVTVLNTCANLTSVSAAAAESSVLSSLVAETGYSSDIAVKNGLLNMLGKSGNLKAMEDILHADMESLDVIAGTVVVSAYSQQGIWKKSLESYYRMLQQGLKPNSATFQAVLTSCAGLATLSAGKPIHACIVETGCTSVPVVQSSLVNFYGKCGSLKVARKLFEEMEDKTRVVAWTAIITGYAQHGHMEVARRMFQRMQQEGVKPDSVAFISVLSVASHAGLLEDACYFFVAMTRELGIPASIEHYGCMVDLLGRSGWLKEAESLVKRMDSVRPDAALWTSLLGSSRVHGNVKLAELAAEQVIKLEPENGGIYVQLSNAYRGGKPVPALGG